MKTNASEREWRRVERLTSSLWPSRTGNAPPPAESVEGVPGTGRAALPDPAGTKSSSRRVRARRRPRPNGGPVAGPMGTRPLLGLDVEVGGGLEGVAIGGAAQRATRSRPGLLRGEWRRRAAEGICARSSSPPSSADWPGFVLTLAGYPLVGGTRSGFLSGTGDERRYAVRFGRNGLRPRHAAVRAGDGGVVDDDRKPHPLRFERAFQGLEIMSVPYRSAIEGAVTSHCR
jgi:hypothetical protein